MLFAARREAYRPGMRYTDELLEQLRYEADPLADRVVGAVLDDHGIEALNRSLRHLVHNREPLPTDLPTPVLDYFARTSELPAWADLERLRGAAATFARHAIAVSLILATDSLVECYAARKGVEVLRFSYRLAHNAYRRVAETAQFMFDVLAPAALEPDGDGRIAIQKVRLMHAAIRHLIVETGRWPTKELGLPICQEDMLGTIESFSLIVIRDLPKLGIELDATEADDWFYFWQVVSEMIGVRPDVAPRDLAEADELLSAIRRRHHGPSESGVEMTRALLEMHDIAIPGHLDRGFAAAVTRHLAGPQIADWLEVPRSHLDAMPEHEASLGVFLGLADRFGRALLEREAFTLAGYQRAAFDIPSELRSAWNLGEARLPA